MPRRLVQFWPYGHFAPIRGFCEIKRSGLLVDDPRIRLRQVTIPAD
jgi:hypothetical protein